MGSGGTRGLALGAVLNEKRGPGDEPGPHYPLGFSNMALILDHELEPASPPDSQKSAAKGSSRSAKPRRAAAHPASYFRRLGAQPATSGPSDLVIAEATLIGMLVRLYGWRVTEPGRLVRFRGGES